MVLTAMVASTAGSVPAAAAAIDCILIGVSLSEGVLVVVHPNFENGAVDPDFTAELLNQVLVPLLDLPTNSLCELQHPLLLGPAEFRPEPLPAARVGADHGGRMRLRGSGVVGGGWQAGGEG